MHTKTVCWSESFTPEMKIHLAGFEKNLNLATLSNQWNKNAKYCVGKNAEKTTTDNPSFLRKKEKIWIRWGNERWHEYTPVVLKP